MVREVQKKHKVDQLWELFDRTLKDCLNQGNCRRMDLSRCNGSWTGSMATNRWRRVAIKL